MRRVACRTLLVTAVTLVLLGAASPALCAEEGGGHGGGEELGASLPLWSVLPFVGILLSIALFPLLAPRFWHHHFPKVSAFWAVTFALPFVVAYRGLAVHDILHIYIVDYIPFIILLWALFTVAGGILVRGSFAGTPAAQRGVPRHRHAHRLLGRHHRRRHAPHPAGAARQRAAPLPRPHGGVLHLPGRQHRRLPDAAGRPAAVPRLPARRAVLLDLQPGQGDGAGGGARAAHLPRARLGPVAARERRGPGTAGRAAGEAQGRGAAQPALPRRNRRRRAAVRHLAPGRGVASSASTSRSRTWPGTGS